MKKLIIIMLLLVLGTNVIAKDHRRNNKKSKSYKCKHIGIQKISSNQSKPKHYFIRPIKHFGHITYVKRHTFKYKS
jgi:hypothetical protein